MDMEEVDWPLIGMGLLGITIIGLMVVTLYFSTQEAKEWESYKVTHHCIPSGYMKGTTTPTVSYDSKGNPVYGVSSTTDQTIYRCDASEIIIR